MLQVETRKLAAIMFTDIVGFSRQMGADEARMLRLLAVHNQLIERAVAEHHGQVIKSTGDGFLVEFPSVVHAVQCAQDVQIQFRTYNSEQERGDQIHIRIGIHLGDIVVRPDGDVQGDGVNIAARLQPLAEPDTICLSGKVYEEVEKKIPLGPVISLGRPKLKNIAQRFPVYLLVPESSPGVRQRLRLQLSRRVRRIVFVLVSVLLLAGIALFLRPSFSPFRIPQSEVRTQEAQPPSLPLPDKPSIVVLPFTNLSGDAGQEYFSDGITEVLTSDLSHIANLFVISRNTAFSYKGKPTKAQAVSKELGVRYVLEGSVQRAGEQVRIVAQLIDATQDHHLWSERYDRPLKDIFVLQDEIVQKIVTTLKLQLTLQEQGILVRKTTDNLEAYDYYLQGMESYNHHTKEANVQARQLFERAVALDPTYADAYAQLGWTYYLEWSWRWSQDPQALEQAVALGQKALTLDGSQSWAHGLLALNYARTQQYDLALVESERAIALDPNNAEVYVTQANVLGFVGKPEDAVRAIEHAIRLNPHYPVWYLQVLGSSYQGAGRPAEAIAAYKQLLVRNPNFLWAYPNLAFGYLAQWSFQLNPDPQLLERALEAAQRGVALNDSLPSAHLALGSVYLVQKQYDQGIAEIERAIALDPNLANSYAGLAEAFSRVGRPEDALRIVEQALRRKPLSADSHLSSGH
jgi:adenylate cyclase